MIYTFTAAAAYAEAAAAYAEAAAAYAEAAAAYATAAAAYADMVKIRLSTALALFSWGLAELGNKTIFCIEFCPYSQDCDMLGHGKCGIRDKMLSDMKKHITQKHKEIVKIKSVQNTIIILSHSSSGSD